jgi:uncharacterized protein YjbI with pentapeptide repeats
MANEEQLEVLKQGAEVWNKWRKNNIDIQIDLSEADCTKINLRDTDLTGVDLTRGNLRDVDLFGVDLGFADLSQVDLSGARLMWTDLGHANLKGAVLRGAHFGGTNFRGADLSDSQLDGVDFVERDLSEHVLRRANLRQANLSKTNLSRADLREADLTEANLAGAQLHDADLRGAKLLRANLNGAMLLNAKIEKAMVSGSSIYGISVWDLQGEFTGQKDLIITPENAPLITVDNIEVAQFIYLILHNEKIRHVINTLTSKSVLILGRFAIPERKAILDALRNKLREYNLLPIVFDFDRPTDKDFTETIKTLAGLCYFVIADITNPKSAPLELQATVPDYQIPFVPIIQEGEHPFAMMVDLHKKYNWVLEPRSYDSIDTLMKALWPGIIEPAMKMHAVLRLIKAKEFTVHPLQDFIYKS